MALDFHFYVKIIENLPRFFLTNKKRLPRSLWIDIWHFHFFLEPPKKFFSFHIFGEKTAATEFCCCSVRRRCMAWPAVLFVLAFVRTCTVVLIGRPDLLVCGALPYDDKCPNAERKAEPVSLGLICLWPNKNVRRMLIWSTFGPILGSRKKWNYQFKEI